MGNLFEAKCESAYATLPRPLLSSLFFSSISSFVLRIHI